MKTPYLQRLLTQSWRKTLKAALKVKSFPKVSLLWIKKNKDSIGIFMQVILIGILIWQTCLTRNQFKKYDPKITIDVAALCLNYRPFLNEVEHREKFGIELANENLLSPAFRNFFVEAAELRSKYADNNNPTLPGKIQVFGNELESIWKKYFKSDDFKTCIRVFITNDSFSTVSVTEFFLWLTPFPNKDVVGLTWSLQKIYRIKAGKIEKEEELPLIIHSGETVILDFVFYSDFFYSEFREIKEDEAYETIEKLESLSRRMIIVTGNFGRKRVYFESIMDPLDSLYHPKIVELYRTFPLLRGHVREEIQ